MVVGESTRTANIMEGIGNTGDVRMHDHRLRLKQRFDIVRKLGQGTYGKVQLGINKKTGQEVAIKTIKKCKIESDADLVRIRREVQIMSSVRHPNIVHIYEVFENSEKMILVMEYCSGGELYDYLSQQKVLPEEEARRLFRQIATAVYYCHIHKICHRDLKLENVLLDETGSAKIADFGLSNVFKETSLLATFCGSPLYASPEIVKGTPYIGPEVDCWSLGVLLYTLVYGAMPFDGSNFKRLVRQISNGDYFEPKSPSSASPLIRDMLTVDPIQRADITYICDHPWVNMGCEVSCLEMSEALATETPVRLDLLLSLAPPAPERTLLLPAETNTQSDPSALDESATDLTSSTMAVEPSTSAEKRILDLVAEGGADAIKPSPTRTIVSAGAAEAGKRKLEQAASTGSATALAPHRKKERVASAVRLVDVPPSEPPVPEEPTTPPTPPETAAPAVPEPAAASPTTTMKPSVKCSATVTTIPKEAPKEELPEKSTGARPRVALKKKLSPTKSVEERPAPEKLEEAKSPQESVEKPSGVAAAADKLTGLSLAQPTPAPTTNHTTNKPKKLSIAGMSVGSFKEQFERRASLTSPPDVKKNLSTKAVVAASKIAKPKAQSEDRDIQLKSAEPSSVRLQQIGIDPSPVLLEENARVGGVKKTESEPCNRTPADPVALSLQDARRSLQNSMAMLSEQRAQPGEDSRRRAARDIISTAIRTGKPPMPYGRSSSAGVTSLATPPPTPPAAPPTAPIMSAPRTFRTEALHTIGDHRNRGTSVERIIPIQVSSEDLTPSAPATSGTPVRMPTVPAVPKTNHVPLRRLASDTSTKGSEYGSTSSIGGSSTGEPIKKSAREFIIPIAVEGKGYVTPRQGSLEPETAASVGSVRRHGKPRRISLVSGGESEDEDDMHMHKLRSSRAARAESVSSGEEEDDEGFQLLTAENLFSTLLHRVRALTNRLNGEEGTGFPQHPHSLFNNLQSPFFNRREGGWPTTGPRDLAADFDTMFKKRSPFPRGSNIKKSSKQQTNAQPNTEKENSGLDLSDLDLSSIQLSEKELEALSGLTPALSRRLQKQLLAHLPPAAARTLRRTLSMQNTNLKSSEKQQHYTRSQSASKSLQATPTDNRTQTDISSACSDKTEPSETATLDSSRTDNIAGETAAVVTPSPLTTAIDSIPTITTSMTTKMSSDEAKQLETLDTVKADEEFTRKELDVSIPQFSTLPRLKRHSILSRESTPPVTPASDSLDVTPKSGLPGKDLVLSRGSSVRSTPDRSLLSKYLTPERTISLEESYSSDSGSLLSEPSYIAAYGSSPLAGLSSVGSLRRHSMRLQGDQSPRKRISRFLRPDFFDTPKDESVYARTKKDKELETQKILKEIREKRNKNSDATSPRSPISNTEMQQIFKDEMAYPRPCFSPLSIIATRERSRSTTPFFPMLNKIKETAVDSLNKTSVSDNGQHMTFNNEKEKDKEKSPTKESRLTRPKSFPIKSILDDNTEKLPDKEIISQAKSLDTDDPKSLQKESKLVRPKSYPTSSPSPEKIYVTRNNKKDDKIQQENMNKNDNTDIEVSFRINLPKKSIESQKTETFKSVERDVNISVPVNITVQQKEKETTAQSKDSKEQEKMSIVPKDQINKTVQKSESSTESAQKSQGSSITTGKAIKTDNVEEKRPTIKKKIIKKVSTKSKSVENGTAVQETSNVKAGEKKKVTRKAKDSTTENEKEKSPVKKVVTKKKSVLQSIGHKLEKLTSSKSNSPEKEKTQEAVQNGQKSAKLIRNQREHSVPIQTEAEPTESSLIKRAVTLTNVVGLNNEPSPPTKTTVSKVLGLFKKFEPKEKPAKPPQPLPVSQEKKAVKENQTIDSKTSGNDKNVSNEIDSPCLNTIEKPKRPTSLLLNGLGRKSKYCGAASDGALSPPVSNDNSSGYSDKTSELDNKKVKNNLKLDFSRLPRVKTNSCSKSRSSDPEKFSDFSSYKENDDVQSNGITHNDKNQANGPDKLVTEAEFKPRLDKEREGEKTSPKILYCGETTTNHPHRNHESTIPEKEDIEERIRRKSFYTRFNEKRHKRKSNLVGPGAQDYNPAARLHSQPGGEAKYDVSPTSPNKHYDLSPNYPTYDLSPTLNCEHSRSFNPDSPSYLRHTSRLDNYGASDRLDNYRSLDRNSTRKYTRSYLDPDAPVSYTSPRYSRTISLFDSEDDDKSMGQQDQHKYNRTLSMYSPGNYATYRPKRIRNPAILLKENEKEISPENILEKIRERKRASGGASSKEAQMESRVRSNIPSKSESNGAERPEKVD